MKTSIRRTGLAVIAIATLGIVAGCSTGSGGDSGQSAPDGEIAGEISFQTWSLTPTYQEYLDDAIAAFQEQHPDVTVELVDQPGDGYSDKVISQASTDTLPDVVNLPPDFALPLAQQGLLYDASQSTDMEATYVAGAVDAFRFTGVDGVYGYPWYLGTDVSYWNTEQMNECGLDGDDLPATVDEQFEQAQIMADNCDDTYLLSGKPGLLDFVRGGVQILNDDQTEFTFAGNADAEAVVQRYVDAYQGGLFPASVLNDDYQGNATLFTEGKVAYTTAGATGYGDFVKNNPSLEGNIGMNAALDTPPLFVQGVSVSANSEHLAAATAFAEFITNADNQNAFAHLANVFPSTLGSQDDPYFTDDDGTGQAQARIIGFESLKDAKVLVPYVVNGAMDDEFKQQIALAMRGDITAAEALEKAQTSMNRLLADAQQ